MWSVEIADVGLTSVNPPGPETLPGHITWDKNQPVCCFKCTICLHCQNSGSSSSITIGCLLIAKHKELSKPEKKTLSASVSAIFFIIPSLFILWSQTEWLKSQSKRQQMKCFPLPSKRAELGSKNQGYFVYPAYSTIKICGHIHKLNLQNDSQEWHGCVLHKNELCARMVLPSYFYPFSPRFCMLHFMCYNRTVNTNADECVGMVISYICAYVTHRDAALMESA